MRFVFFNLILISVCFSQGYNRRDYNRQPYGGRYPYGVTRFYNVDISVGSSAGGGAVVITDVNSANIIYLLYPESGWVNTTTDEANITNWYDYNQGAGVDNTYFNSTGNYPEYESDCSCIEFESDGDYLRMQTTSEIEELHEDNSFSIVINFHGYSTQVSTWGALFNQMNNNLVPPHIGTEGVRIFYDKTNERVMFWIMGNGTKNVQLYSANASVINDTWHTLFVDFNSSDNSYNMYLESSSLGSGTATAPFTTVNSSGDYVIGTNQSSGAQGRFMGMVDFIGVYSDVLTSDERNDILTWIADNAN